MDRASSGADAGTSAASTSSSPPPPRGRVRGALHAVKGIVPRAALTSLHVLDAGVAGVAGAAAAVAAKTALLHVLRERLPTAAWVSLQAASLAAIIPAAGDRLGPVQAGLRSLRLPLVLLMVTDRARSARRWGRRGDRDRDGDGGTPRNGSSREAAASRAEADLIDDPVLGLKMCSLVQAFRPALQWLKRRLADDGVVLPVDRFDASDAELARFLVACGLLDLPREEAARDSSGLDGVVNAAAARVVHAVEWRSSYPFMPRAERRRWKRYARYHRRDAHRRPVLYVDLDVAFSELPNHDTPLLVRAVVTQMEVGCNQRLSNAPGDPERFCVVVKCCEASLLKVNRLIAVLRPTTSIMQANYPERLGQLFLVGMPGVLGAVVGVVRRVLPERTREKLLVVNQFDPRLPAVPSTEEDPSSTIAESLVGGARGERGGLVRQSAVQEGAPRLGTAGVGQSGRHPRPTRAATFSGPQVHVAQQQSNSPTVQRRLDFDRPSGASAARGWSSLAEDLADARSAVSNSDVDDSDVGGGATDLSAWKDAAVDIGRIGVAAAAVGSAAWSWLASP